MANNYLSESKKMNFFEKHLTLWVALCMVLGVLLGKFVPGIVYKLRGMEFGGGSHLMFPVSYICSEGWNLEGEAILISPSLCSSG
jgi:ACR3 family arsenite efflux pump ArsB